MLFRSEPGWAIEFARLDALGMRILPVPRRADGPDLEVMARYCEAHNPKLFVSVSVFHNPTGYCLSPGSAHRVLQLANAYDFHIVEDDTYSHIAPDHATRLCALDGLQRTVYVSGFAKILAPNWRIGFLAAPPGQTPNPKPQTPNPKPQTPNPIYFAIAANSYIWNLHIFK